MASIENSNGINNSAAALEHKLRATLNSYRQRRDEAHRGQQLAAERLHLVTEEFQAVQSSVQAAQMHLASLQEEAGGSLAARQEHANLQREAEHLTKEVNFQHAELVQKRTKFDAQKESTVKEGSQRQSSINNLQRVVQERRQRLLQLSNSNNSQFGAIVHMKPAIGFFKLLVETESLHGRWTKILSKRTATLESATNTLELQVEQQQRICVQYEKLVPPKVLKPNAMDETDDEASVAQSL